MGRALRALFYLVLGRLLILVVLGVNARNKERLPAHGPAVVVCNHNSHLDTLLLMSLLPWRVALNTYPVAAADYFLRNPFVAWFSTKVAGIIPIKRQVSASDRDVFDECHRALDAGKVLIVFPEGSRGEPEEMAELKSGIAHLAKSHPEVLVVPVFTYGLGRALPRGEALLVPFFCDVFVGEPIVGIAQKPAFMAELKSRFDELSALGKPPARTY